jgi:hypothetical protein
MADLEKLPSTVSGGASSEALTKLATEAEAGVLNDSKLQLEELEVATATLVESLEAAGVIASDGTLNQLISAAPEIGSFISAVQEAVTQAKEATPLGVLLTQQLQAGAITQEQFESQVQAITLASSQLQAAIALALPQATQSLLISLSSNSALGQLEKLIANSPTITIPTPTALPLTSSTSATPSVPKLQTEQTDTKLGNSLDLFGKMIKIAAEIAAQNVNASAAALISLKPQPRVMTGARAVVKINGKVAMLCNNLQYEISSNWSEVRGVDELIPNDLAPDSYSVKGSMSLYRVPNQSPVSNFIHQDMFRGIIWPYTTIEIRDKRTDELIMLVKRCAITSRGEAFSKGTLTTTNLTFVGIGFRDEEMPELLPDTLSGDNESNGGLAGVISAISNLLT